MEFEELVKKVEPGTWEAVCDQVDALTGHMLCPLTLIWLTTRVHDVLRENTVTAKCD